MPFPDLICHSMDIPKGTLSLCGCGTTGEASGRWRPVLAQSRRFFGTSRNCFNLSTLFIANVLYCPGMPHSLPWSRVIRWILDSFLHPVPQTTTSGHPRRQLSSKPDRERAARQEALGEGVAPVRTPFTSRKAQFCSTVCSAVF